MRSCSDSAAVTTAVDLHYRKKKLRWVEHKNTATEERKNEQKLQTTVSNGSDLIFRLQSVCSTSAATKSTKCRYVFERGVGARHPQTGFRRHQPKLDKKACGEEWKSHTERTESPVFASAGQQLHHHVYYNSYLHFLNPKEEEGSSSSQRQQQQQDQT